MFEILRVSSSGSAKLYSASFNNQMELGAGMGCQFHGNTIEIKRELLRFPNLSGYGARGNGE